MANVCLSSEGVCSVGSESWWVWYIKLTVTLGISLFGGYGLVGALRGRCKKSDVVWKLTLIVFSSPVLVFMLFSMLSELQLCERYVADAVSFGCVAGMLLKLVTKPSGEKTVKLIVQQVNGEKHDVWLSSSTLTLLEARNHIAEAMGLAPNRISIESGKGKALEDLTQPLFDHIAKAHKSTDFFGFVTAACYITVSEEAVEDDAGKDIEWKEKDRNRTFNPFKLLLDSRAKYGDPFMIIGRSASSDDAKKFHVSPMDRFAGAAPGNAPLFVQLKLYAWSATAGSEEEGKAGGMEWDNSSEMGSSSIQSTSTRNTGGGGLGSIFRRRRPDEGQLRGKPIRQGDSIVVECDGRCVMFCVGFCFHVRSSLTDLFSTAFLPFLLDTCPLLVVGGWRGPRWSLASAVPLRLTLCSAPRRTSNCSATTSATCARLAS